LASIQKQSFLGRKNIILALFFLFFDKLAATWVKAVLSHLA